LINGKLFCLQKLIGSPRQQRHLAFISEFNVQMLYLPGLKMLLQMFYLALPPSQLVMSLLLQRPHQSTLRQWPPSKSAARKRSVCWAVHLSPLLYTRQTLSDLLTTSPRAFFAQWWQKSFEKTFLFTCTTFPTLGGLRRGGLFLLDMSATPLNQTGSSRQRT
jgi:hypothetical protein